MSEPLANGPPELGDGVDHDTNHDTDHDADQEMATESSEDDVEADLLELRRLIEATVAKHRSWKAQDSLITAVSADQEDIVYWARQLVAEARESIDVLVTDAEYIGTVRAAYDALGSRGRNIRFRLLSSQAVLSVGLIHPAVLDRPNTELRVARVPALQVLLVDSGAAMVTTPTTPATPGRQTSVVRAASFVAALDKLFGSLWGQAVGVKDRIDLAECKQVRAPSEILERLRAGVTDEVAARELSVSVRTYRRYVAEIMKLLGAHSRFQAGVRAAELGLLSEDPNLPPGGQPDT